MQNIKALNNNKIKENLNIIKGEISGEEAFEYLKHITKYHRVQASPGYREAAEECERLLLEAGVHAETVSYPASLNTKCFTQKLFKEWYCREAYLDIVWPFDGRIADYEKNNMSVIQRSARSDYRDVELEIVYVPDEVEPKNYADDLSGKIIFVMNCYDRWVERAVELNAAGLVTVSMPEIKPVRVSIYDDPEMADKCANLAFHLQNEKLENKLFGFVLTPAIGKCLREECLNLQGDGKFVKAKAFIDSELYDGSIENLMADIPGETSDEILMVAHLCHPKPSANDNASGAACAMEALRCINTLIEKGKLKKPRRSIRAILVPEFTGTYAYIADNEKRLDEIKAGINLDMVGARQSDSAGTLLIIDTPDAAHSFVGDLSRIILEEVRRECPLAAHGQYTGLFNSEVKPFMLGSDHYILSDPTVGIPSIALTQWPDKMYHTSGDIIENIDKKMLYRVSSIAAGYIYALADLDTDDMNEVMFMTRERIFKRITSLAARSAAGEDISREAGCCSELAEKTCDEYARFFKDDELLKAKIRIEEEKDYLSGLVKSSLRCCGNEAGKEAIPLPIRMFRAPLSMRSVLSEIPSDLKRRFENIKAAYRECGGLDDYIIYAINGVDSEEEIAGKVSYETGVECSGYVHELLEFLHNLNFIKFIAGEINNDKQDD